ncbi:hypothetical protein, partial [Lawsonibacter sp.]|uniref:hypothetical protein n=1 Tax=Lawsonibacter sp. TaxID=2185275 RepID=UPI0025908DE7
FSCTIFSDMVYRLLSEWCVATSFYQSSANHVSFYPLLYLRNLFYLIGPGRLSFCAASKRKDTPFGVSFRFRLPKTLLEKSLAELSRPQTTEGKEAPSFPATRASEMTPFMTDRATFLQESSPVRHAFLGRKRPEAFFGKLRPDRDPRGGAALLRRWRKPLAQSEFTSPEH